MKKLSLTSLLLIAFLFSFSQEQISTSFCGYTDTLSITKLEKCATLSTNLPAWEIASYTITIKASDSTTIALETKGAKLTEQMLATIKEQQSEKIYIEKINIVNSSTGKSAMAKYLVLHLTY